MAQRGRSDWERHLAAQRREAERQAREAARYAKEQEKGRRAQHLASQQQLTETKTAAVASEIATLDQILVSALGRPPITFDQLRVQPRTPPFSAPQLTTPTPAPDWRQYAPPEPQGIDRWFGGVNRYHRKMHEAKHQFEEASRAHQAAEAGRMQALAAAQGAHRRQVEEAQAKAAAHNHEVDARKQGFNNGEPESVEWFVNHILKSTPYPKSFPRKCQVAYRPHNRDLVIEMELPHQNVIPAVREYRYIKSKDVVQPVARPDVEIRKRYARLIASTALRTLHEVFVATSADVVDAVTLNGRVETVDRATGKTVRPHLISVSAARSSFADLQLAAVEPAACLKHLNALVSPNPFDMEAVEPFIAFDLKRFRLVEGAEEMSDLDSRRNLLRLSPTEFEKLVKDLFVAMGAEAWRTVPSKDGGVDAVATSKNLFFGGVCLIQAKRWTNLVGLDAVHALTGVMTDHNATTGVLVTTSWFSRRSEEFAQRNRITLINGAELKHLIKQHLGFDVVPGTTPPKRLRASNNAQTGKPGPAA
jgi:restriction system protein